MNQIYRGLEFLFSCLLLPTLSALINDQFSTLLTNSLGKQQDIFALYFSTHSMNLNLENINFRFMKT